MPRRRRKTEAEKIYDEMITEASVHRGINEWRAYWREAGPIRFAEEVLTCPDDVPEYPNWRELQESKYCEGCKEIHPKFKEIGVPYHMILSKDQKEILYDLWKGLVYLAIVSAGRGAGKTIILAIRDCWLLCCFDRYDVSAIGGSGKQSKLLQKYINLWRIDVPQVRECIIRSLRGIEPKCISNTGGEINFLPCSGTSVRGPHVPEVQIDEACEAEKKSEEGREATEAIWWQVIGKRNSVIILTSTTHYISGKFYEYLTNPDAYGFKVYMWAIVEHVSGKPPEEMFKDRNPDNWRPRVWWVTQKDIVTLRKKASDAEWLCEALGRPSLASGQVFAKDDMDAVVCDKCEECFPYRWDDEFKCKLIEEFTLGDRQNPTRHILDRRSGFDFGDPKPCALTICGRKGQRVFVLYSDERTNVDADDLVDWVDVEMKRWGADIFIPDPSIGGKHITRDVDAKGYATFVIGAGEKFERVLLTKRIVERHAIVIPIAYWKLINSMRQLTWDKEAKIRKYNDHSFDSVQYVVVDWDDIVEEFEGVGGGVLSAILGPKYKLPTEAREVPLGIKIW